MDFDCKRIRFIMRKSNDIIKKILITGNPGVGKTTLIHNLISKLNVSTGGFWTSEMRDEKGNRWGFKIVSLNGTEGVMASVDIEGKNRISRYGVDVEVIDRVGVNAVKEALKHSDIIVIDEIGRMELFSRRFQDVVMESLDSPKILLGTITAKDNTFTKKIKEMQDIKIVTLTRQNFNEIETYLERLLVPPT
jgi:nucleoside-triphosphatase